MHQRMHTRSVESCRTVPLSHTWIKFVLYVMLMVWSLLCWPIYWALILIHAVMFQTSLTHYRHQPRPQFLILYNPNHSTSTSSTDSLNPVNTSSSAYDSDSSLSNSDFVDSGTDFSQFIYPLRFHVVLSNFNYCCYIHLVPSKLLWFSFLFLTFTVQVLWICVMPSGPKAMSFLTFEQSTKHAKGEWLTFHSSCDTIQIGLARFLAWGQGSATLLTRPFVDFFCRWGWERD